MNRNNKYRHNATRSLQDILSEIIDRPVLSKGIRESRVVNNWAKVMGASVARKTTRLYLKSGVLYVSLESSIVRNELIMHKDKIIHTLNQEAGGKVVYDIVFR